MKLGSTTNRAGKLGGPQKLWAVLGWLVGAALVAGVTSLVHKQLTADLRDRFDNEVIRITSDIQRRFTISTYGLKGARGIFVASQNVSKAEFKNYVESRDLDNEFPGLRGMGYIERVPRSQLNSFAQTTRADGAPDFQLKSLSSTPDPRSDAWVIKYIEPFERNRQALGLDIGSEPTRRVALERAMTTGKPTLTGVIRLLQDQQSRPGFLLFVPVYRVGMPLTTPAERTAAVRGLAYAPMVLEELLAPAFDSIQKTGLTVQVLDPSATPGKQVLHSIGSAPAQPRFSQTIALDVLDSNLQLKFDTQPGFEAGLNLSLVYGLAFTGLLGNTLLWLYVGALSTGKQRAESRAQALTQDLEKLALVAQKTTNAVVITNADMRILWVNEGFTRVSGYTLSDAVGKTPRELLASENTSPEAMEQLSRARERGESCKVEILDRAKDGREYWMDIEIQPIRNNAGELTGFIVIGVDVTQTKEREALLIAERQRTNNILVGTQAGTWEWHVPSGQTVFNERWAQIVGYELSELEPVSIATWVQLCHPDDLLRSTELLQRHFAGELDHYECESRMRHKDGHWVWVMDRGILSTREADGSPGWMYGTHQDVTAQKTSELALRASEFRLKTLSELSAQWFWETDTQHRFSRFESGDLQRLAQLNATALGKTRWEVGVEPINTTWTQHQDDLAQHRPIKDFTYRKLQEDGSTRYWHVSGAPWYDENGVFSGYIGTGADVTELKETEMRIARSEALLERTGELAKVGGWRVDLLTGVLEWSAQACHIHDVPVGFTPTRDVALSFYEPHARPAVVAAVEHAMRTGDTLDEEFPVVTATGRRIWIRLFGKLEVFAGRSVAMIGGFQDITEQRAQADALREAKHSAELASEFKSQFLANMSHEIRTPMNAVLGMLKLLQTSPLQPRQLDYAQKAESSAQSLLGLLNDILDFSKVEAGKMTLDIEPFSLDQITHDLSVIFSSYAQGKSVEVLFDIDPALPRQLVGDVLRLKQILINLGGNAIKFTPEGNVVMRMRLEGCKGTGDTRVARVHIAVQDNGIGIAPENQQKIFAGFIQAEGSTTRRFGGTGLGLSICKRLIELMGGELQLDSALGQGSTFSFTIDLPAPEAAQLPPGAAALPASPSVPSVLLVDDNPMALQLMARMARSLNWNATAMTGGANALQSVEARLSSGQPYQIIFTDCEMPGVDGWELAAGVRALYNQAAQPQPMLIMVSAHGEGMIQQQSVEMQGLLDGYLVKPITASMLFDATQTTQTVESVTSKKALTHNKVQRPLVGLRLLVVEDNAINQQVAEELLSTQGAQVDLADNGQRGVEAVQAARDSGKPYHAVLMDMQMPVMDGIEATRCIRSQLGVVDLPIIAMTANAMSSDRDLCLQAGMNDHIGKPFDLDRLVMTLLNWTKGAPTSDTRQNAEPAQDAGAAQAQAAEEAPILDRASALKRIGGSESLLLRMGTQFLKDLPPLLASCAAAVQQGQFDPAQKALHAIKGVAATLGADRLATHARLGEAACKSGGWDNMAELEAVYQLTAAALLASGVEPPHMPQALNIDAHSPLSGTERDALLRLKALLKGSDMGVFEALDDLQATAQPASTRWKPLEEAVEAMNLDAALALVDQALNA